MKGISILALFAAAIFCLMMVPAGAVVPSASDTNAVHILWLRCINQDDLTGYDDIRLEIKVPDQGVTTLKRKMKSTNSTRFWNIKKSFYWNGNHGPVVVKLWEEDKIGRDDLLGEQTISTMGDGSFVRYMKFKTNSYYYDMAYRVTSKSMWDDENSMGYKYKEEPRSVTEGR